TAGCCSVCALRLPARENAAIPVRSGAATQRAASGAVYISYTFRSRAAADVASRISSGLQSDTGAEDVAPACGPIPQHTTQDVRVRTRRQSRRDFQDGK